MTYTLEVDRIEEQVVPGKRLGRHYLADSRSLGYPVRTEGVPVVPKLWRRHIPILDQGNLGSCTGNGETGALGTSPLYEALPAGHPALDEPEAVHLYGEATRLDPYPGSYPPTDTGSNGLSACKAAKNDGLISGYLLAATLLAMQVALQTGPVVIGINWYDSFDNPDSSGLIAISPGASIRGGHEPMLRGVDPVRQQFYGDNSWGPDWGDHGSFTLNFSDMDRLLSEKGDCYQPLPLTTPVPTPIPTPGRPADQDDRNLTQDPKVIQWAAEHHTGLTRYMANAYETWKQARGL